MVKFAKIDMNYVLHHIFIRNFFVLHLSFATLSLTVL